MEEEFIRSADGSETVVDDKEATILNLIRENNRLHAEIERLRGIVQFGETASREQVEGLYAEIARMRMVLKDARGFIAGMVKPPAPWSLPWPAPPRSGMPASYYPCHALLETIDKALGHD